ncbi:hypothetical protein T4B_14389 [Trichinella pseudospiralis]|uniref:Uncharacterized protein n=1 Tax=Trichinella pseudospiralis TaxID=6337 RepID=A0A0V1HRR6_TRIPS|nr:hypothetical protein T4B_14389 [Trichinella pseudospiralis]
MMRNVKSNLRKTGKITGCSFFCNIIVKSILSSRSYPLQAQYLRYYKYETYESHYKLINVFWVQFLASNSIQMIFSALPFVYGNNKLNIVKHEMKFKNVK